MTVVAGTNSGRTIERTIGLPVLTLSTPTPFGIDITDQAGEPLTDQLGNALTVS